MGSVYLWQTVTYKHYTVLNKSKKSQHSNSVCFCKFYFTPSKCEWTTHKLSKYKISCRFCALVVTHVRYCTWLQNFDWHWQSRDTYKESMFELGSRANCLHSSWKMRRENNNTMSVAIVQTDNDDCRPRVRRFSE